MSKRAFLSCLLIMAGLFSACQRLPNLRAASDLLPENPAPVFLSGPWSYFPDQHCTGLDCSGEPVTPAPLLFKDGVHPRIDGTGFGTYVIELKLPEAWHGGPFGLMLFDVGSSYNLFIDGRPHGGIGTVGTSLETSRDEVQPRYYQVLGSGERITIAVQVANFNHPRGGLRKPPVFGPAGEVMAFRDADLVRNLILLGIILGMAFYHFGLFLNRRDDVSALVFGAFCLAYAIRMLFTVEVMILVWIPDLTYLWQIRIEYITFLVAGPLFALFLGLTYPFRGLKYALAAVCGISGLACLFILVTPIATFAKYLTLYQLTTLFALVVCLAIWGTAIFQRRTGARASLLGGFVASAAAINDILYYQRIVPIGPIFQYGVLFFILAQSYLLARLFATAYKSVQHLSKSLKNTNFALARFVPTEFLKYLQRQDITEIHLGDQVQKQMHVMFTDIRNFTTLSEQMSPEENFNFLNSYLKRVAPVVNARGGFIDKFIGDAVMALFPGSADDALSAAVEMHQALRVYNIHRSNNGYDRISIGIGLHTGDIMLGIIGHENRMEGTVISDTVNTASRIEGLTRRYGSLIIVTDEILNELENPDRFERRRLGLVRVKGKQKPFPVYDILNGYSDDVRELYLKTRDRFHEAVDLAYTEQFTEAAQIFSEIAAINPLDGAVKFYLERIEKRGLVVETH